jgi:hypothetical protein
VGYFIARRLPDRVLIKTFLLLTMRGTPESQNLHRLLRLRGCDRTGATSFGPFPRVFAHDPA